MKKVLLFSFIFFILTLSLLYLWFNRVTSRVFVVTAPQKVEAKLPDDLDGYFKENIPFNIAVLGYGGGNHDGAYLTDTIIVTHIDPAIRKVWLVSIPRDLWVNLPTTRNGTTQWKINAAYALGIDDNNYPDKPDEYQGEQGGGSMSKNTLSQVTGLDIPYFVALDFSGFTRTIDTLGGVNINVFPAFTDPLYPIQGKEADLCDHTEEEIPDLDALAATTSAELVWPCRYETLQFESGPQHMDGATALKYVRSRHSRQDGSDFGRALRQQKLILAVKEKVMSIGFVTKAIPFINSLGYNFKTDLTLDDVRTLIDRAEELNGYEVQTLSLTDDNYLVQTRSDNGQLILASIDGIGKWNSIHEWLELTFAGKPVPAVAVVQILNGTQTPGLALHATNRLEAQGFRTVQPESASRIQETTTITIYDHSIRDTHIQTLTNVLGVGGIEYSDEATPSGINIQVVLGSDYEPEMTTAPQE